MRFKAKLTRAELQAIQARMESRFDSTLKAHFDAGGLGFTNDGLVSVRDAAKIALKDRVAANQAVADQNRDAKAVYREISVANGHPDNPGVLEGRRRPEDRLCGTHAVADRRAGRTQ